MALGYAKHQKTDDDARLHDSGKARNGSSSKNLKTAQNQVTIDIPRDRKGEFEPQIIPKETTRLPEN